MPRASNLKYNASVLLNPHVECARFSKDHIVGIAWSVAIRGVRPPRVIAVDPVIGGGAQGRAELNGLRLPSWLGFALLRRNRARLNEEQGDEHRDEDAGEPDSRAVP